MAQLKLLSLKTPSSLSTLFNFLFFFITCVIPNDTNGDEAETTYMVKLMNVLTPTPSNWSNNTNICLWSGVTCDAGFVDTIDLSSKSLMGILPSGLNDSLLALTKLYLRNNSLSGPLPSLANLENLEEVLLSDNNFTSIPDGCFQGLFGLQMLSLGGNVNLTPWKFPTDVTQSLALQTLELSATNLVGSLPDIFHSLQNLQYLYLSYNSLNWVLRKSFARSRIDNLFLNDQSGDKLSGTIEVFSSMTRLSAVYIQGNRFEGPIPDLSNCTNLFDLELQDNQLTGVVPHSLMNLSSLGYVYLDNNFLQGPVPVFKDHTNVSLGNNTSNSFCLDHVGPCDQRVTTLLEIAAGFGYPIVLARSWRGNNPCEGWSFIACDGSKIRTVNLTKLNLTGTISPAFCNLTNLQRLFLGDNNLLGSIPEILATLSQLEILDVSNNNISGNIPKFSPKVRFIATGNDLLGHPQANGTTPSKTSHSLPWIAGASVACAGVIVIVTVVIFNRARCLTLLQRIMSKNKHSNNVENLMKSYGSLTPKRYGYSEVKRMKNLIHEELEQGGYGIVYRTSLSDGRHVAIKELRESKGNGVEFVNEVVSISKTSHVNIVTLVGFCFETNKRALIYEFMPNGSLDKFIPKSESPNDICNLDWSTLYQITIGVARGLEYLHQGCNTRILHLDIKPQNILLDENFCPKIADFGLAKICKKKEGIVSMSGTRGTPGYIAPEVFNPTYGGVSDKSDVYSYGMLILEVVGGRKNYYSGGSRSSEMYFPNWIYKDLEQGNIPKSCLANKKEEHDMVMKITLVSLWCIQPNPSNRPLMSKVIEMLEGPLQSIQYPPKPNLYSLERPTPLRFSDTFGSNTPEMNSKSADENGSMKEN